jgi:hypothetical protein
MPATNEESRAAAKNLIIMATHFCGRKSEKILFCTIEERKRQVVHDDTVLRSRHDVGGKFLAFIKIAFPLAREPASHRED